MACQAKAACIELQGSTFASGTCYGMLPGVIHGMRACAGETSGCRIPKLYVVVEGVCLRQAIYFAHGGIKGRTRIMPGLLVSVAYSEHPGPVVIVWPPMRGMARDSWSNRALQSINGFQQER